VILDAVSRRGKEMALKPLLIELGKRARAAGIDCILFLDGMGEAVRLIVQTLGYRKTKELYHLLIWPKATVSPAPSNDLTHWRYSFADHDAF
jgi:hypothetical protein